ncbi:DNA repair protein rad52 [Mortierella sp. AM989]|nr:DNA repair protein rad52 [Mortierella sp. AM989]
MIPKTEPGMSRNSPHPTVPMTSNSASENLDDNPIYVARVPQHSCTSHQNTRLIEFTSEEKTRLNADLPKYLAPEFTSTRSGPGRTTLTYIEGWRIKNLANKLFGFNGWSSSITDVTVDFMDQDREGKVSVGVSVMVKVTLKDGTFHEDIGYGSSENQKSKAASFEKAKKEATTDALKRALTSFGNVLGTCLYDKNFCKYLSSIQKADLPKFDPNQIYGTGSSSAAASEVKSNPYQAISSKSSGVSVLPQAITALTMQPVSASTVTVTRTVDSNQPQLNSKNNKQQSINAEEDDDQFFGADIEEPRASQPESPRMSDFDFHLDVMEMMAVDDSPVKGKTGTPTDEGESNSNGSASTRPPSLRRSGTFSRSTSSPSVVQTTPTNKDTVSAFSSVRNSSGPQGVAGNGSKNVLRANSMAGAAINHTSPSSTNQNGATNVYKPGTASSSTAQHSVYLLKPVQGSGLKRPLGMTSASDGHASTAHKEARLG